MNVIPYTQARINLAKTMDTVCDDHVPIVIAHKSHRFVVIVSLDDYQSLEETAYLLRSPRNAQRLIKSIAELESGCGIERDMNPA